MVEWEVDLPGEYFEIINIHLRQKPFSVGLVPNPNNNYGKIKLKDTLLLRSGGERLRVSLSSICWYDSVKSMLVGEGLDRVLPQISNLEEAVTKYTSFLDKVNDNKILALGVKWN